MDILTKRFLLFGIGCIGTRSVFIILSATAPVYYLRILGFIGLFLSIGVAWIYVNGLRKVGFEIFGDAIWWNYLRPIHSVLYAVFAYYAIRGNTNAWKWLALDLAIGITAFFTFHYRNGNFGKAFKNKDPPKNKD